MRDINTRQPLTELLCKISLITQDREIPYQVPRARGPGEQEKMTSTEADFRREVDEQISIYNATNQYLHPVCPGVTNAHLLRNRASIDFIRILQARIDPGGGVAAILRIVLRETIIIRRRWKLGVVYMKFMTGAVTFSQYLVRYRGNQYKLNEGSAKVAYEIYRLASRGLNHGDLHFGNILITEDNGMQVRLFF